MGASCCDAGMPSYGPYAPLLVVEGFSDGWVARPIAKRRVGMFIAGTGGNVQPSQHKHSGRD